MALKFRDSDLYRAILDEFSPYIVTWRYKEGLTVYGSQSLFGLPDTKSRHLSAAEVSQIVCEESQRDLMQLKHSILAGKPFDQKTICLRRKDGAIRHCEIRYAAAYFPNGKPERVVAIVRDTEREAQEKLDSLRRAEHNVQTGIYNHDRFLSALTHRLAKDERELVVMQLHVSNIRQFGAVFSSSTEEKFLRHIARVLREEVTVLGGDCGFLNDGLFDLCIPYENEDELALFIKRVDNRIRSHREEFPIFISFGACLVTDRTVTAKHLCKNAMLAMMSTLPRERDGLPMFNPSMREQYLEEQQLIAEMGDGIIEGQFAILLQPKYSLASGAIVGAECLIRWDHPRRGLLGPDQFIPLLERSKLVIRLDEYVFEQACRLVRVMLDSGARVVPLSCNFSWVHLYDERFVTKLQSICHRYNVPPEYIMIELKENSFSENSAQLLKSTAHLCESGFLVTIDDFGGFSSLKRLAELPADEIKIKRDFLLSSLHSERGQTVLKSIVFLAKRLGITTLAEGVETPEQADFLRRIGCDRAQGFLYSRPIPSSGFLRLVQRSPEDGQIAEQ